MHKNIAVTMANNVPPHIVSIAASFIPNAGIVATFVISYTPNKITPSRAPFNMVYTNDISVDAEMTNTYKPIAINRYTIIPAVYKRVVDVFVPLLIFVNIPEYVV